MNEFLKVLLNIRSLRATCRELSLEQLEEALEKLSAIVAERQQDEAAERQAREEHLRKINEYSEMLKAAGIDPAELVSAVATNPGKSEKAKRAPRPAKYRYQDNGVENLDRPGPYAFGYCQRSGSRQITGRLCYLISISLLIKNLAKARFFIAA